MLFFNAPPAQQAAIVYEAPSTPYLAALSQASQVCGPGSLEDVLNHLFIDQMLQNPQLLTSIGLFEPLGLHEHNRYLNDFSTENAYREVDLAKSYWISLQVFSLGSLSQEQELTRQLISNRLKELIDGEEFLFHGYPINQQWGVTQRVSALFMNSHPLKEPEDVQNFIFRLGQIDSQFQQVIERMEYQREKGIAPPQFAIAKVIASIQKWIEIPVEKNPFYIRLASQSEEVLLKAKNVIENLVYPAYRRLQSYLEQRLGQLDRNDGVWALPNGDRYYAYLLRMHTTLPLTAEEIHQIGLREVERIEKEIQHLLEQEDLYQPNLTLGEHFQQFGQNPQYFYENTEEGRRECLKKFEEILLRSREKLGPLFPMQPKAALVIRSVPSFEANGATAAYYSSPSVDGSRPGTFYVNLGNLKSNPKFAMETIAVHEGEPGHHFERALAMEANTHIMRKLASNSAYVEGWALYVEKLAYEQGFYSSTMDQIGHLQYELIRAARLVVDTGIHWKKWTREEAAEYLIRVTGMDDLGAISEIERYFVMPGQACSYKLGQLKILELREEAKQKLGDQFDLREFHADILKRGCLPLWML